MRIELKRGKFLRMSRSTGSTLTTHAGAVWITEEDSPRDVVLHAGQSFALRRPGLTLVEAFSDAAISLGIPILHPSPAEIPFEHRVPAAHDRGMKLLWHQCVKLLRAWRAARARGELRELSDRTLKDIGLTRGQIGSLFR